MIYVAKINKTGLYEDLKSFSLKRYPSRTQEGPSFDPPLEVTFFAEFILLFPT